ncbi:hypothetical protein [Paraburkholderia sediminicola]|uniref:hypothetical protein n=1 Tax=Paraburkholderia sediminicola TaxID=458836 RepID=UPI0038B9BA7B
MPKIETAIPIQRPTDVAKYTDTQLSEKGVLFKGDLYYLSEGHLVRDDSSGNGLTTTLKTFGENMSDGLYLSSRASRLDALLQDARALAPLRYASTEERQLQKRNSDFGRTLQVLPKSLTDDRSAPWKVHHATVYSVFSLIGKKLSDGTIKIDNEKLTELGKIHLSFFNSHIHFYNRDKDRGLADHLLSLPDLNGLIDSAEECKEHIDSLNKKMWWKVDFDSLQKRHPRLFEVAGNV